MKISIDSEFKDPHLGTADPAIGMMILNAIVSSKTPDEIYQKMADLRESMPGFSKFFIYGFGRNHLWVKQRSCEKETKNWITVIWS